MSIFGTIMSKIFHGGGQTGASGAGGSTSGGQGGAGMQTASASSAGASTSGGQAGGAGAGQQVDVGQVLSDMASKHGERLDWKHSIVDLMKLLGMDSSLTARKQLADELGYTGDKNDSASMNIWLSKQVMRKLAENGGKLPDDLKHA